jgi:ribosomal protein S18 acetylase RimI-like enzyme
VRCGDAGKGNDGLAMERLSSRAADEIARLHGEVLPDDVLPALGRRFLERYYGRVLENRSQVVLGVRVEGRLAGFCQLSLMPITPRMLLTVEPWAPLRMVGLAVMDPQRFVDGVAMALRRPSEAARLPEIAFIGVHPDYRRAGIGRRMLQWATRAAADAGAARIVAKTASETARAMYESAAGARLMGTVRTPRRTYWYLSWNTTIPREPGDVSP